jgi:hypothetical protein
MFEGVDRYLFHFNVFSSPEDEIRDGTFFKNSFEFLILLNENDEKINIDDNGDLDLSRPERIDFNLGI